MNVYFRRKYLEQMNLDVTEVRITANASVDPSNLFSFTIPDDLYQNFDTDNPREINYLAYAELTPDSPEIRLFETGKILQIDITLSNGTTYEIDGSKFYKEWMNTFKVPLLAGNPNIGEISVPYAVQCVTDEEETVPEKIVIPMTITYDPHYFSDVRFHYKAVTGDREKADVIPTEEDSHKISITIDPKYVDQLSSYVGSMHLAFTFCGASYTIGYDRPIISRMVTELGSDNQYTLDLITECEGTLINQYVRWLP